MDKKKITWTIITALVIALGIYLLFRQAPPPVPETQITPSRDEIDL